MKTVPTAASSFDCLLDVNKYSSYTLVREAIREFINWILRNRNVLFGSARRADAAKISFSQADTKLLHNIGIVCSPISPGASVTTRKRLLFQLYGLSGKSHQNNLRQSRVKSTPKSWKQRPKTVKVLATRKYLDVTDPLLSQVSLQHSIDQDNRCGPVSRYGGHSWKSHRNNLEQSRATLNSQTQDPQTSTPSQTVCHCHYEKITSD